MTDTFTLDVAQAAEIKHAVIRAGGTNADIKALTSGDMFAKILPVLRGTAAVVVKKSTTSRICHVVVDRNRSPQQVIEATGRKIAYLDNVVFSEMPREGNMEDEVIFFELNYDATPDELDHEYAARHLRPDPYAVAQVVIDDRAIADEKSITVQWRDKEGRACFVFFFGSATSRAIDILFYKDDRKWDHQSRRFGGVRK